MKQPSRISEKVLSLDSPMPMPVYRI